MHPALFTCFHSGVEASAAVSNPNGAPDLQHALSLLSNSSAGAGTNQQPTAQLHHHHAGLSTLVASSSSVMQASSPGLWQDGGGAALGHHAHAHAHTRFQALDATGSGATIATTAQELLQLPRPPSSYDSSSSHYDLMR
jgi:hypothetical protein